MRIMARTLRGDRVALDVDGANTVAQLKSMIMAREGVAAGDQRLFFAGRHLDDDGMPVAHYGVRHGSVVFVSLRLRADDASQSQYVLSDSPSISLGTHTLASPTNHSVDMEGRSRRCVTCKRSQSGPLANY
jgi:hypothetical protein